MSSRTSFFNKALFLSDMKRYWWIGAAHTLLLIVGCIIPLYNMCLYHSSYYGASFYTWGTMGFVSSVIFSLGTGVILFSYMHFNGSVSQIHSLPIKRSSVFITKLISALTILITPIIIAGIILVALTFGKVCSVVELFEIGKFVYVTFSYTMIILSLTLIVNMMTGNPLGTVVFTAGFSVLPLTFMSLFTEIARSEIFGYTKNYTYDFMNILYLEPLKVAFEKWYVYPVISVVFLLGAYALYRIRKSESHGEVISFKWLIPVFIGIIATLASGIGYLYAKAVLDSTSLLMILPFGILGTAIAHMISKKSLDFKGCVLPVISYTAFALIFCAVIHFDLTGYEKRVPDIDKISSVTVNNHAVYQEPDFTEREDLENIVALHSHLIEKQESHPYNGMFSSISIKYNLKNGKTLCREYTLDMTGDEEYLRPIYETEEFRKGYFKLIEDGEKEVVYAEISDRRLKSGNIMLYPDNEDMHILVEAIKEDMRSYPYENFRDDENYPSMDIGIHWEYYDEKSEDKLSEYIKFEVHENAVNTIEALKKAGVYELLPKAEDIKAVNVRITDPHAKDEEVLSCTVTDEEKLAQLYDAYNNIIDKRKYYDINNVYNVFVDYTTKDGFTFSASCSYDKEKLPQIFSEL